jgi:hypothetical protein
MGQARKATDTKFQDAVKDAKNLLIDSVGGSSKVLLKKKAELENLGYDTFMLMTYVSPITSLDRNKQRDRSLLPSIVLRSWRDVNKNIDVYRQAFGQNFILLNNDPDGANKEFDEKYIYKTYIEPLGQVGKVKTPEEKAKSAEEGKQLYSDIKQAMSKQPEFNNFEQSQTKINQFIQS